MIKLGETRPEDGRATDYEDNEQPRLFGFGVPEFAESLILMPKGRNRRRFLEGPALS